MEMTHLFYKAWGRVSLCHVGQVLSVFLKRVFAVKPSVMFVYKPQFVLGFVLLRVATDLNNDTVFPESIF